MVSDEVPKLQNVFFFFFEGLVSNLISISQLCDQGMEVHFNKSDYPVTNKKGEVLMKGIRSKNNCYKWVPQQEGQNEKQSRMLHKMLKHQGISNVLELPHSGGINHRRSVSGRCSFLRNNQINVQHYSMRDLVKEKILFTEDLLANKNTEILEMKQLKKLRDNLVISQNEGLPQLMYDRRARTFFFLSSH